MKYLLDTHVFIWFIQGDTRLSNNARVLISEPSNEIAVSRVGNNNFSFVRFSQLDQTTLVLVLKAINACAGDQLQNSLEVGHFE